MLSVQSVAITFMQHRRAYSTGTIGTRKPQTSCDNPPPNPVDIIALQFGE